MTVLITGSGLVGAHAARALVEAGEHPVLYDIAPSAEYLASIVEPTSIQVVAGDLLDLPWLLQTFRDHDVRTVVHTASLIGGRVEANPYWGIQNMLTGSVNVLEAARLAGVQRVVFCSSQSVYAVLPGTDPIREDEAPVSANGFYAACKISTEYLGANYHRRFGLEFIVLRPTPVYGYGRFLGGSYTGHLFHRLISAAARGEAIRVSRHAAGVAEWVHAADVAQAIALACQAANIGHRVYNVGTGQTYDFGSLVDLIRRAAPEARIELTDDPPPPGVDAGPPARTQPSDMSRARRELGFEPRYTLEVGIREYLAAVRAADNMPLGVQPAAAAR